MMTNLFALPVTILIIQLFKRSKRRLSRSDKLNKILNVNKSKTETQSKSKPKLTNYMLPWWCKIVAYSLSFVIIGVSSIFILVKGIALSNDSVAKWLSSLVASILFSVIFVEPFKVGLKCF